MSSINNPDVIGYDFYEKPESVKNTRVDVLFNRIYGKMPVVLLLSDPLEAECLKHTAENFEPINCVLTVSGDRTFENAFWQGRGQFEGVILRTTYKVRSEHGEHYSEIGGAMDILRHADVKKSDKVAVDVVAACQTKEQAEQLKSMLIKYTVIKTDSLYILSNQYGDLMFSPLPMPGAKTDLELNYGPDFLEVHNSVVDNLNNKTSGLYLFYGPPGTGKSSYIKHLLTGEVKRKIAYIPVSLINQLMSPDLVPLLMDNKDIVLVMEDAEQALLSRDIAGDNATIVSSILNLTDGFIGQALNISIIATFNTEKDKIDEALLRKGRLRLCHEFGNLPKDLARKLAQSIGHDPERIEGSMSLADVYNLEADTGYKPKEERRVGFN